MCLESYAGWKATWSSNENHVRTTWIAIANSSTDHFCSICWPSLHTVSEVSHTSYRLSVTMSDSGILLLWIHSSAKPSSLKNNYFRPAWLTKWSSVVNHTKPIIKNHPLLKARSSGRLSCLSMTKQRDSGYKKCLPSIVGLFPSNAARAWSFGLSNHCTRLELR